jgi:hypothetical protein
VNSIRKIMSAGRKEIDMCLYASTSCPVNAILGIVFFRLAVRGAWRPGMEISPHITRKSILIVPMLRSSNSDGTKFIRSIDIRPRKPIVRLGS